MKTADINAQLIGHYGSDLTVVNAARVSMDKESPAMTLKDEGLIKYLHEHKHTSPFNHAFLSFRCKAPIFVARQLVKHKFMPWNEVSRRYVDTEPEFYFPEYWRKRAENIKQGSSDEALKLKTCKQYGVAFLPEDVTHICFQIYTHMLQEGVAPEQARMVLPQNTMTEWIWSGTLGAWLDMLRLRLDAHSQYESRILARQVYEQIKPLFPVSVQICIGDIKD